MIYLELFISFIKIGAFSFGGGYACMPLIQEQVIQSHHWLTLNEFTDLITISQMTPGPIAINSATFVGTKIAGFPGAIIATIGCILPSCIIVTTITYLYVKYRHLATLQAILNILRPTVIALIAVSAISISSINITMLVIFIISLYLLNKYKLNPILVIFIAGIINTIINLI